MIVQERAGAGAVWASRELENEKARRGFRKLEPDAKITL